MKKTGFALLAALVFVGNVFATEPIDKSPNTLSKQIQEMLTNNKFQLEDDLTADVRFTVNKQGEIVVLSIDTESENLVGFVKNRLNYKKVELDQVQEGKIYTVPVRITA